MKKNILLISVIIALVLSIMAMPIALAESPSIENDISINKVVTPHRVLNLTNNNGIKSIDLFVGDEAEISTDILVSRVVVIENPDSIRPTAKSSNELFSITEKSYSGATYDPDPMAYLRRTTYTIKANAVGNDQFIVTYSLNGKTYFDSINVNIHEKNIESIALKSNVTTLRTNQVVDFDILVNGIDTLDIKGDITCKIGGNEVVSLKGYKLPATAGDIPVEITYDGKTYKSTITLVEAVPLSSATISSQTYGFLLSRNEGIIPLYVTAGSYPNITIYTDSAMLTNTEMVESDKDGYDKYNLTIKFLKATENESMLITADNEPIVTKLNIIDKITSVQIVPEDLKFESGKVARFHIAINGVKDVDTEVKWMVNGSEMKTTGNVLEYKSLSQNKVTISATVGDAAPAEFSYEIDTSTNSIILTVVVALVVIIICIPILIALKKAPKPDIKSMLIKDNDATITLLEKIKKNIAEDNKSTLKHLLKVATMITRSEKRATQESFECENKAFGGALSALSDAKELMDSLIVNCRNNDKDTNLKSIDTIIERLSKSNEIIKKVKENM